MSSSILRLELKIDALCGGMLDRIPNEIWQDPKATFFDPAMAGGQFVTQIVHRLRKLGYDDDNIRARVFGSEENSLMVNFVVETFKLPFTPIYDFEVFCKGENPMKFDVIIMNPPYQAPQKSEGKRGGGDLLWPKFVENAINSWSKENGYVVAIHPSGWRKPESERSKYHLFQSMTHEHHMEYLEIHDSRDGMKTFGAATRYDWYVIHKNTSGITTVLDQEGQTHDIDLLEYEWLPNHSLNEVTQLVEGDEPRMEIIFSRSNYGSDKPWVSEKKDDIFRFPLVHSTPKAGNRLMYSSRNDKGHFGIPKAIFGDSGIGDVIIDMDGEYGMTQHAMAIPIQNYEDGLKLKEFLMSDRFAKVLDACCWSNFQIDWRMFNTFKEGFWRA